MSTCETVYQDVISSLSRSEGIFQTKRGLYFKAVVKNQVIYIEKASDYTPSSKLSAPRPISKKEFLAVCPYFERWLNEERGITTEICKHSMNHVYVLSILKKFK
ncbi:MAG: hypothetical protein K0S34_1327 [Bacillales bacterium]|jgi:hypothetical protein|nr:hypothetical protein [Bacillales bacterium]